MSDMFYSSSGKEKYIVHIKCKFFFKFTQSNHVCEVLYLNFQCKLFVVNIFTTPNIVFSVYVKIVHFQTDRWRSDAAVDVIETAATSSAHAQFKKSRTSGARPL